MDFEKALEYQSADRDLTKLEILIKSSEEYKNVFKYQKALQDAKDFLMKSDSDASELMAAYDRLHDSIRQAIMNIDELATVLETADADDDVSVFDYYQRKLDKEQEIIVNAEREIAKIKKRIDELINNSNKSISLISDCTVKQKEAKAAFDTFSQNKKPEADMIIKKLGEIKKTVPEELLATYAILKKNGKWPVFVPLNKKQCSGCGMDVDANTMVKLKSQGDYSDCPNCTRIIFVK